MNKSGGAVTSRLDDYAAKLADGVFDVQGASKFSGQSRTCVYNAMADGSLPYLVKGCRRFIAKSDLVAWMAATLKPATA